MEGLDNYWIVVSSSYIYIYIDLDADCAALVVEV